VKSVEKGEKGPSKKPTDLRKSTAQRGSAIADCVSWRPTKRLKAEKRVFTAC